MEKAKISLECPPGFHLAPRRVQNGARPGFRAILHGECALGALEGRFWFPGRSGHIGGRTPAQGVHPRAVEALGARNADLPVGWSLSTSPSPKPYVPQSVGVRAEGPGPVWVGLTSGQGILNLYQGVLGRGYQDGRCIPPLPKTLWPAVDQCACRAP